MLLTTSMLQLPDVTLIALTGKNYQAHKRAIKHSTKDIKFGGVKLVWDETIKNIDDWNYKVVFELWKYVETDFALLIHPDGFVVNPESWNNDWLNYDYIGAPWPLPIDDYSYRDINGEIIRVGNSVSLRSKHIMALPDLLGLEWKSFHGNTNEDGYLCVNMRHYLLDEGVNFAPLEVAKWFSRERDIPENADVDKPFCFHMPDLEQHKGRNKEFEHLL